MDGKIYYGNHCHNLHINCHYLCSFVYLGFASHNNCMIIKRNFNVNEIQWDIIKCKYICDVVNLIFYWSLIIFGWVLGNIWIIYEGVYLENKLFFLICMSVVLRF